jgi:hypothetical protein
MQKEFAVYEEKFLTPRIVTPGEEKLRGGGAEASENGLDMDRENSGNEDKQIQGRAFC